MAELRSMRLSPFFFSALSGPYEQKAANDLKVALLLYPSVALPEKALLWRIGQLFESDAKIKSKDLLAAFTLQEHTEHDVVHYGSDAKQRVLRHAPHMERFVAHMRYLYGDLLFDQDTQQIEPIWEGNYWADVDYFLRLYGNSIEFFISQADAQFLRAVALHDGEDILPNVVPDTFSLPDMDTITWQDLFELRRHSAIDDYRAFVHRHHASGNDSAALTAEINQARLHALDHLRPAANGSKLKRIAANLPVPLPIPLPNPYAMKRDYDAYKAEKAVAPWLCFIHDVRATGDSAAAGSADQR